MKGVEGTGRSGIEYVHTARSVKVWAGAWLSPTLGSSLLRRLGVSQLPTNCSRR